MLNLPTCPKPNCRSQAVWVSCPCTGLSLPPSTPPTPSHTPSLTLLLAFSSFSSLPASVCLLLYDLEAIFAAANSAEDTAFLIWSLPLPLRSRELGSSSWALRQAWRDGKHQGLGVLKSRTSESPGKGPQSV